jgi:hypothetical protein
MAMSWAFGIGAGVAATIRSIATPIVKISQKIVPVMEAVMVMVGLGHIAICGLMTANAAAVDSYEIGDIEGGERPQASRDQGAHRPTSRCWMSAHPRPGRRRWAD